MWSGPSCAGGGIHGDFVVVIQRPQRCKWAAHAHCVATPNIVVCLQHLQLNASETFYWLLIIIFLILIIIIIIIINTTFGWCCGIFLWIEVCFIWILKICWLVNVITENGLILYAKQACFSLVQLWQSWCLNIHVCIRHFLCKSIVRLIMYIT